MNRRPSHHIRVVTWNIHGCIGTDGVLDPERTARVIRALDPDVIALQEVDSRRRRRDGLDVFAYLSRSFGGYSVDAKTVSTRDGHYGQMLISRWPLQDCRVHDISVDGREPRKALEARVALPAGPIRVIATHLGLNAAERRLQFHSLADFSMSHAGMPYILMGDLNEWRRRGLGHRVLSPLFDICTSHRTFPASLPLLPLDRIWCRPGRLLARSWAEGMLRRASDHLPLAADLDFHVGR